MFIGQHGPCAICRQQTVIETLCLDRRPRTAAERHLICEECEAWRDLDEADPDVARLVQRFRSSNHINPPYACFMESDH
jgi:hypothetical protein